MSQWPTNYLAVPFDGIIFLNVFNMSFKLESKDLKKRLRAVEDNMKSTETENIRYLSILKEVHTKISPIIVSQVQSSSTPPTSSTAASNKTSEKIGSEETSTVNGKISSVSE